MSKFDTLRVLELKVPPPIVGLVMGGFAWLTSRAVPGLSFNLPHWKIIGSALCLAGVSIAVSGVASFRRAKTTINPMKPETASALVNSGIYQYTRNPMYLGMLLVLLGWAVFMSNALAFVFLPVFILYLNRFQIGPEERALDSAFGQEFAAYKAKVRRWL